LACFRRLICLSGLLPTAVVCLTAGPVPLRLHPRRAALARPPLITGEKSRDVAYPVTLPLLRGLFPSVPQDGYGTRQFVDAIPFLHPHDPIPLNLPTTMAMVITTTVLVDTGTSDHRSLKLALLLSVPPASMLVQSPVRREAITSVSIPLQSSSPVVVAHLSEADKIAPQFQGLGMLVATEDVVPYIPVLEGSCVHKMVNLAFLYSGRAPIDSLQCTCLDSRRHTLVTYHFLWVIGGLRSGQTDFLLLFELLYGHASYAS
jgi:hypothetical protein